MGGGRGSTVSHGPRSNPYLHLLRNYSVKTVPSENISSRTHVSNRVSFTQIRGRVFVPEASVSGESGQELTQIPAGCTICVRHDILDKICSAAQCAVMWHTVVLKMSTLSGVCVRKVMEG